MLIAALSAWRACSAIGTYVVVVACAAQSPAHQSASSGLWLLAPDRRTQPPDTRRMASKSAFCARAPGRK